MNKLVIPTILAATVLVAGMFAAMPVYKASAVHTTILSQLCTALFGTSTCPGSQTAISGVSAQTGTTTGAVAVTPGSTTLLTASKNGVVTISCTAESNGSDGTVAILIGGVDTTANAGTGAGVSFAVGSGQAVALQDDDATTADATATCRASLVG